jgi:hypothetical protein
MIEANYRPHVWVNRWWPLVALLVGIVFVVIGGILLSP